MTAEDILYALKSKPAVGEWTAVIAGPDKSALVITAKSRTKLFEELAAHAPHPPAAIF